MKNKIRTALGLVLAICVSMLAVAFPASAAGAPYIEENGISPWAREDVSAAYEAGLLSQTFDLGEDYTAPVTRLQLARLAVDFIAAERNTSALILAEEYGLVFKADDAAEPAPEETAPEDDESSSEPHDTPSEAELPELVSCSLPSSLTS